MLELSQQLHGYRHGHQILSTSVSLPKNDQTLIDRLSDIAGPLAPGELFSPYLTFYPLPSGSHYVVARTWQDLDAPRAGCVRTRSLLIPMSDWLTLKNIAGIAQVVTAMGPELIDEKTDNAVSFPAVELPPYNGICGIGLVEALFLEERAPIVVFDADNPELIALRIITAIWPGFRRDLSLSTFARSPRMIQRRNFDLIFAPSDSRSRFADWTGRRIDGRRVGSARHRWSSIIFNEIFISQKPSLINLDKLGEMSEAESSDCISLRISLLWLELVSKLKVSPNAALGLLDIANTRSTRNIKAIREIEPALASSTAQAIKTMPPKEAWVFLGSLFDKLQDINIAKKTSDDIKENAKKLAISHPVDTIESLNSLMHPTFRGALISAAADGISLIIDSNISKNLLGIDKVNLLNLLLSSDRLMGKVMDEHPEYSNHLEYVVANLPEPSRYNARNKILKFLIADQHLPLAEIFFMEFNETELISEIKYLYAKNKLLSSKLRDLIIRRAIQIDACVIVRENTAVLGNDESIIQLIFALMSPSIHDLNWVVTSKYLNPHQRVSLLSSLMLRATDEEFHNMLTDNTGISKILDILNINVKKHCDLLQRIAMKMLLEPTVQVEIALSLLPHLQGKKREELAEKTFELTLDNSIDSISDSAIKSLLLATGNKFNVERAFLIGLKKNVSRETASRNLIIFNSIESKRNSFVLNIELMARALSKRFRIDLNADGVDAAAALIADCKDITYSTYLNASATLLPTLLDSPLEPISPLISVTFPPVYRELRRENTSGFFNIIFKFEDWDKCKQARRELVESFMRSNWRPSDIALAVARTEDTQRIINLISLQKEGMSAIREIEREIEKIPAPWSEKIRSAIDEVKSRS